jgi:hypothetical protein
MKYVSEDHSLTVLVASIIASLFIAVLVGGCGNIVIGVISLIISCILFGISFLQLNKLLYAVYGSIFLLLSATSISNYRKDIHDPFALFKIPVHYPRWIEAHQNMLTVFASIYMIVSILCVREAVSKMLLIWSCILSSVVGILGYLFLHDMTISLFLFSMAMFLILISTEVSIKRSIPYMKGYHILTLADIPLSTIHYINGHDVSYKGYASEEWKHLPLDAKKKQVMQEIIDFVGTLFPGRYLVETHEAMIHLIEKNLPCNLEIKYSKKIPALSNRKANSEFRTVYGKEAWRDIAGKRKLYIWYFELIEKKRP